MSLILGRVTADEKERLEKEIAYQAVYNFWPEIMRRTQKDGKIFEAAASNFADQNEIRRESRCASHTESVLRTAQERDPG